MKKFLLILLSIICILTTCLVGCAHQSENNSDILTPPIICECEDQNNESNENFESQKVTESEFYHYINNTYQADSFSLDYSGSTYIFYPGEFHEGSHADTLSFHMDYNNYYDNKCLYAFGWLNYGSPRNNELRFEYYHEIFNERKVVYLEDSTHSYSPIITKYTDETGFPQSVYDQKYHYMYDHILRKFINSQFIFGVGTNNQLTTWVCSTEIYKYFTESYDENIGYSYSAEVCSVGEANKESYTPILKLTFRFKDNKIDFINLQGTNKTNGTRTAPSMPVYAYFTIDNIKYDIDRLTLPEKFARYERFN